MLKKLIGKNIKKTRLNLGMSQGQLAKNLGKSSPAYIAFIEAGKRNINIVDFINLARILRTTVAELIGEKEYQNKIKTYTIKDENGAPICKFKM